VLEVTLNVAGVLKGNEGRNQIAVATKSPRDFPALGPGQEVIVGVYEDPDWLGGEVLRFVFLAKDDERIYVVGGVNGCYPVADDRLVYDNRRTIPLRLSGAKRLVQRAVEQGR
jgi:hypothetical protein